MGKERGKVVNQMSRNAHIKEFELPILTAQRKGVNPKDYKGSFRLGFVNLKARLGSAWWFKSSARLGSPKSRLGYITSK